MSMGDLVAVTRKKREDGGGLMTHPGTIQTGRICMGVGGQIGTVSSCGWERME